MSKGMLWFPDSLVGKFALCGAVLSTGCAAYEQLAVGTTPEFGSSVYAYALLYPGVGAFLGLLVFGATMPFVAWWSALRAAGHGLRGCALRMLAILVAVAGVWVVLAGINSTPHGRALLGLGVFALPWVVVDSIKLRKLRELKNRGVPEARR